MTAQVSLAGRFLVFMPFASRVGVSRKIGERAERQRLRGMVQSVLPEDSGGVIVRTVGEDVSQETFQRELTTLIGQWKRIKKKTRALEKAVSPEYLAQLIEAYNYYFYHYDETPLLVVDTNEIDFVNRPGDFEDLVGQIQKAKKGVQYYVPAASAPK